jgi:hypothetical protein
MCSKAEDWINVLRCERTKIWRSWIVDKRSRNINAKIGIRKIVGCKKEGRWQKIGIYRVWTK